MCWKMDRFLSFSYAAASSLGPTPIDLLMSTIYIYLQERHTTPKYRQCGHRLGGDDDDVASPLDDKELGGADAEGVSLPGTEARVREVIF
ncbi:hypothetical protein Avbf_10900 [Armadillidium vulgare]|nr:hypothetical protein Avbf_10900 [Armadillidium vulgare]